MVNPQEIQWFSGFFEGEGCFTITKRSRNNFLEPKVSFTNTDQGAIEKCESILNNNLIPYKIYKEQRKGKLPCYEIYWSKLENIITLTNWLRPFIECDRERLEILSKFCNSRLIRRTKPFNNFEWELYSKLKHWRSSETTREESYSKSLDWLAGIYEAEGSFMLRDTGQPTISLCNTNTSIIFKAKDILDEHRLSAHLNRRETGNSNHQPYWIMTLHGKNKGIRFISLMSSHFRYRNWELKYLESKIMI